MPKPYPKEFRDDVVAVARKGQAPLNQIAKDFGISDSEGCLHNWMKKADVADGNRPGEVGPGRGDGVSVRSVSPGRLPNRACGLHRTRLSTSPSRWSIGSAERGPG